MDIEQLSAQLKQEWAGQDRRLEQAIRLNTRLLRENLLEKGRLNIRRRGRPGVLGMIAAIGFIVMLGAFNAKHFLEWRFFIPGVLLHLWMVATFAIEIYQRERLRNMDYSQPVVKLQGEFERFRVQRLHAVKWMLLSGQAVWWVPFLIVFFKGLLGVDLFALSPFMTQFIWANIAVSLLVIPVANGIAAWIHHRFAHRPGYQKFADSIAGPDIVAAREFLATLARFEEEEPAKE